jgi:transposase
MHLNAAGMDVGATEHWVAVPEDRDEEPVRRFGAFTAALSALAAWLQQCQIATVVLEATGGLLDDPVRSARRAWV